ncbi:hypothetical protein A9Q84_13565 [Halobacteriovorax marinus]|uniref:Response regulatory domain-containing protein n=1 Tax=Halobacteriovorax marinus TaxID=97084 RepID=A0A1Y5F8S2_9BACT|nr:hypothetical protein A9Q84_13565 [Halobacteriovorax marinus]
MTDKTILVIDDDPIFSKLMSRLFKVKDIETDVSATGIHALNLLKENHYDLVILDYYLPDILGDEVLKFIKGNQSLDALPVVAVSSSTDDKIKNDMLQRGVNHFLSKPISKQSLKEIFVEFGI